MLADSSLLLLVVPRRLKERQVSSLSLGCLILHTVIRVQWGQRGHPAADKAGNGAEWRSIELASSGTRKHGLDGVKTKLLLASNCRLAGNAQ